MMRMLMLGLIGLVVGLITGSVLSLREEFERGLPEVVATADSTAGPGEGEEETSGESVEWEGLPHEGEGGVGGGIEMPTTTLVPQAEAAPGSSVNGSPTSDADGSERLAKIFEAMKPLEAAQILEELSDTEVRAILQHISARKVASILGHFDSVRAASLSRSVITQGM